MAAAFGAAAILLTAAGALAAECPKDKVLTEHADIGWKDDVGIRRKTMALIDLNGWREIGDLRLRMRRLIIPPGGVIPTHDHTDRPSLVYFVTGEVIEHNSKCAVPIVHKAASRIPNGATTVIGGKTRPTPTPSSSASTSFPELPRRPEDRRPELMRWPN